jgi:hypothetical protein
MTQATTSTTQIKARNVMIVGDAKLSDQVRRFLHGPHNYTELDDYDTAASKLTEAGKTWHMVVVDQRVTEQFITAFGDRPGTSFVHYVPGGASNEIWHHLQTCRAMSMGRYHEVSNSQALNKALAVGIEPVD